MYFTTKDGGKKGATVTQGNKYTKDDLSIMQAWPLARKIQVTQTRLIEWKARFDGQIYISFSGGKDSTVLADLAARVYAAAPDEKDPLTLAFVDTGLEYQEIRKFVQYFADWLKTTYGIPVTLEIVPFPKKQTQKKAKN